MTSARPFRSQLPWQMAAWAALLFLLTVGLYSRWNDFPFYYHTDEPRKVEQIVKQTRDFHHPQLMLNAATVALSASGLEKTYQNAAVAGRWMNAIFAAGAVVALTLLAWHWGGSRAAVASGTLLLLENNFFEAAHYLKEDPALMLGISVFLLTAAAFWHSPSRRFCLLLGMAAGLSTSGKYIGVVTFLFAVPIVVLNKRCEVPVKRRLLLLVGGFLLVISLINYQVFSSFDVLINSLKEEIGKLYSAHSRKGSVTPVDRYSLLLTSHVSVPVIVLALGYVISQLTKIRQLTPVEWVVILLPTLLATVLLATPKSSPRYFLPIVLLLDFSAGMAIARLSHYLGSRKIQFAPAVAAVVAAGLLAWAVVGQIPPLKQKYRAFSRDNRKVLAEWVNSNVPADAVIVEDDRVYLRGATSRKHDKAAPKVPHTVQGARFAPDLGTIQTLQAQGVDYVAVF
ncbi:MAG TPA: phospholipid carrier-dependent glycosyltransferase, partial [Chthoniobacterales bacterium]